VRIRIKSAAISEKRVKGEGGREKNNESCVAKLAVSLSRRIPREPCLRKWDENWNELLLATLAGREATLTRGVEEMVAQLVSFFNMGL
jgi:hypothetical protein